MFYFISANHCQVQMYRGSLSLLLVKLLSEFHHLPASKIPSAISSTTPIRWLSFPVGKRPPSVNETQYVIWANSRVKDLELPSSDDFYRRKEEARNIKDRFSVLKDVQPQNFYNILGEVIKIVDLSGVVALYLSDYTANSSFYNYSWGEGGTTARDGDEFGYTKPKKKATNEWPGPYGKLSIQLTLFDEHAEFVRENVEVGQWVLLSNVQIKYGKMGNILEGFLRHDRDSWEGKIQVSILKWSPDVDEVDDRLKEVVRRKYEWWKKFKAQRKEILNENQDLGTKRKLDGSGESRLNSKQRRKERRAAVDQKIASSQVKATKDLNLNDNSE
jgi:protection-of-telomeres protein 1